MSAKLVGRMKTLVARGFIPDRLRSSRTLLNSVCHLVVHDSNRGCFAAHRG
jgi:hypothetical protein